MTANLAFDLSNTLALLGWGCLGASLLPMASHFNHGLLFLGGRILPLVLCILYLVLLLLYWGSAPQGNYNSLENVGLLFDSPGNLAAGWVHFLAFDLFIGRWMIDDVTRANRAKWPLYLCLPFTFMVGPVGLLLYFMLTGMGSHRFGHQRLSGTP
ncbi:ABA4-like family protein [Motilimonas eburnea]|uniref:ABA4-like family protein n=1 Tax=Motilimonas eburnea TaxID=1737488 RepID=UPI001E4A2D3D|nr:ABA4-like family protein [Motilimonas eburnea]MCE2570707.1 DUF4281 domain-containing protein [Motilimonas eburnea]